VKHESCHYSRRSQLVKNINGENLFTGLKVFWFSLLADLLFAASYQNHRGFRGHFKERRASRGALAAKKKVGASKETFCHGGAGLSHYAVAGLTA
jgi:hypothetical protein